MIYRNIIYIDTLIIINLYVNFLIIKTCGVFLHRKMNSVRCLLCSAAGGISALTILLPTLPVFINLLIKLIICVVIILISFGYSGFRDFLKNIVIFIVINVIFAGLMLVLQFFASPFNMVYKNGVVYFDISFISLTLSTAAAYFLIKTLRYFLDVKFNADKSYDIGFVYNGKKIVLKAFADSGNTLVDFFTGLPVIICDKNACESVFDNLDSLFDNYTIKKGIRFLPYSTVNSSGIIPVFRPDSVVISGFAKKEKRIDALIGISKEGMNKNGINAIFNPKLLI